MSYDNHNKMLRKLRTMGQNGNTVTFREVADSAGITERNDRATANRQWKQLVQDGVLQVMDTGRKRNQFCMIANSGLLANRLDTTNHGPAFATEPLAVRDSGTASGVLARIEQRLERMETMLTNIQKMWS